MIIEIEINIIENLRTTISYLRGILSAKCCFVGNKAEGRIRNFGMLCFLETPVLRFALLPYYRRFDVIDNKLSVSTGGKSIEEGKVSAFEEGKVSRREKYRRSRRERCRGGKTVQGGKSIGVYKTFCGD